MAYQPNPGKLPDECVVEGENGNVTHLAVHVRLFGGWDSKKAGYAPWPSAGGRPPNRWAISRPPHDYEIAEYEVA